MLHIVKYVMVMWLDTNCYSAECTCGAKCVPTINKRLTRWWSKSHKEKAKRRGN